jgi:hypothetical protein
MIRFLALVLMLAASFPSLSQARSSPSSSSHVTTFRTSECKSSSCFAKHSSGSYVHPITERNKR